MAHKQQKDFCDKTKNLFPEYFQSCKVLEIGSFNVNGSVRDLFVDCEYIGLDILPGDGVDVACEAQKYDAADGYFDTIISCECFEHNPFFIETIENAIRMLKKNGLLIFTCATTGRPVHGTASLDEEGKLKYKNWKTMPNVVKQNWNNEYYHNVTIEDIVSKINLDKHFSRYSFEVSHEKHDLYFFGQKS